MEQDLVSIVIPVYNGEQFIKESILSCINQTYKNIEIIVVNDGSLDRTRDIVLELSAEYQNIKFIDYKENKGKVVAINKGVEEATGEYIAIHAADDVCFDYRIKLQVETIQSKENIVLVCGDMQEVDENLNIIAESFKLKNNIKIFWENQTKRLIENNFVSGGTILIDKMILNSVFPIPAKLKYEDWWIGIISSTLGKIYYIDKPLIKYRKHSYNSNNKKLCTIEQKVTHRINLIERNLVYYNEIRNKINDKEVLDIISVIELRDYSICNNSFISRWKKFLKIPFNAILNVSLKERVKLVAYVFFGKKILNFKFIK